MYAQALLIISRALVGFAWVDNLYMAGLCCVLFCVIIALIIQALDSRFRILICRVFREIVFYCNIHDALGLC